MMAKILRKTIIVAFWMILWWLLDLAVNNSILLASPVDTAVALWRMLCTENFYLTATGSLLRIGAGFALGFSVGVLLAMASKRFGWPEELLAPFMNLVKTIPVASFVVLLLIWWGSSFLAVAISFLVVLPQIYISTLEGLKNADGQLLEMAKVFRISLWNRFFYIYRPAMKPFLLSGLKISLGMCWKSGVAAEVIGTPDYSIGERLYLSKVYLDTAELFGWTAVIIVLCLLFEKLVMWISELFFAWEPVCRGAIRSEGNREGRNVSGEITLEDISKSYNGKAVLEHFSATYQAGKTYYLTSPSGSGKTTLLRILAGLTGPDNGNLSGAGKCSMVFQEDRLCEDYSAVKNVELVRGADVRSVQNALQQLLPIESLHKPCRELSGGMKRRVALVRAMEADSDVILLDEPFTGMDAETKKRAESYIRERQEGRILVIATHIV